MSKNTTGTAEEKAIHKEATRLRKMTDIQLVTAFREAKESGNVEKDPIQELINGLQSGECPGIGSVIAGKLERYAINKGLISR